MKYFRVAGKPSVADFVLLVSYHYSTMEALAISFEVYDRHFKEKFDLVALRDAAYHRANSGPLKLPTLSGLSSRLIKDLREKLPGAATKARRRRVIRSQESEVPRVADVEDDKRRVRRRSFSTDS